ncbi:MAG TPA: metallophosphoesterase, partial [Micromonosporaceae bacterium]
MTATAAEPAAPPRQRGRNGRRMLILLAIQLLLFGVPYVTLFVTGQAWPTAVVIVGTVVFVGAWIAFPFAMFIGHGRPGRDGLTVAADSTLGIVWVLFTWSILGNVLRLILWLSGVHNPAQARIVAIAAVAVAAILLAWGNREAMRVPRLKHVNVAIEGLGAGLDGVRVVLLTDTHYGPINRARWSARVTDAVNALDPDIVCHTGDIADGTVDVRREQAAPLGLIRAKLARAYVTGNHEYFGEADVWLGHMRDLGWEPLHNRHLVVERDGAQLVIAGVDDR